MPHDGRITGTDNARSPQPRRKRFERGQASPMTRTTLPFETWRTVIDTLRANGRPHMLDHADILKQQLDQHAPDEAMVSLSLTDDIYPRSFNWARLALGIPL